MQTTLPAVPLQPLLVRTHNTPVMLCVQDHCEDPSDMLPGVYALVQTWLQEVVLSSFTETADQQPPTLQNWFDSKWVTSYLMVSCCVHAQILRQVARICCCILSQQL